MLSDDYERQLKEVHAGRSREKAWGTTGRRNFGEYIRKYIDDHNGWITTVLDFGAGQGTLGEYCRTHCRFDGLVWTDYDPGIPGKDVLPEGEFDLVVSSDVLEHVEPEFVQPTLDQIAALAKRAQYHHIACDPCGLILPDGRNAHLSVHEPAVWREWIEREPWRLQYYADRLERKRSGLWRSCHILLEK